MRTESPEDHSRAGSGLEKVAAPFVATFEARAGAQDTAVYLVGSPALGDTSPRQSNLDLVVVTPEPLTPELLGDLSAGHRTLRHNGRDGTVLYTTWDSLLSPPSRQRGCAYIGRAAVEPSVLANPMTWAILAESPHPLHGRADPSVHRDADALKSWFAARLPGIVEHTGTLLWRRHLSRVVLQSTRCAHGALTGEVASLRGAGELMLPTASHTSHRVITDALGYREGANTSMYWGPFERKSNAVTLADDLLRRVRRAACPA